MPGEGTTTRVVVIDDDEAIRALLIRSLKRMNCEIFEAGDGRAGLETIGREGVHVIFLDLRMPGMDGHTVLRRLAQSGSNASVVVMSGDGQMDDVIDVMRSGAVDYLRKPWTPAGLMTAFARAVDRYEERLSDAGAVAGDAAAMAPGDGSPDAGDSVERVFAQLKSGSLPIPQAPGQLTNIRRLNASGDASMEAVIAAIEDDAAFAAGLTGLSGLVRGGDRNDSVRTALSLLGLAQVHAMAETFHLSRLFPGKNAASTALVGAVWRHAVARAVSMRGVADLLAFQSRIQPDTAFLIGLLADVGAALLVAQSSGHDSVLAQTAKHHTGVSQFLLSRWGFDAQITEAVANHHAEVPPRVATEYWQIGCVAETLAIDLTGAPDPTAEQPRNARLAERCTTELQLGASILEKTKHGLQQEFRDFLRLLP